MPTKDDNPAARVAAARNEATAADAADAKASKALLDKLLRQSVEKRFAAFEADAKNLTATDRRELLKSIKDQESPTPATISAATASRFAIWRSRLRYRVVSMAAVGMMAGLAAIGWAIAYARTPDHAVEIVSAQTLKAEFKSPRGVLFADRLIPGQRYVVVRQSAGETQLRLWVPQEGYAVATVPSAWLRRVR